MHVLLDDQDAGVRQVAVEVLGEQGERVLLEMLHDENGNVRQAAVEALGQQGERIPFDSLIVVIGDESEDVRMAAIEIVKKNAPEALLPVIDEAVAVLQGQAPGRILCSLAHGFVDETLGELGEFGLSSAPLIEEVAKLLDWHYWQVRVSAARALGQIRRNIPDAAIKRLLELRRNDPVRAVREAADDALAEILSLETGIEDD